MASQDIQPRARAWTYPTPRVLLKEDSKVVNIRITDIRRDDLVSTLYLSPIEAQKALSCKPPQTVVIRVISIYSRKTISPLDITHSLLEHVFRECKVHADFADVVASFGQDPNLAEGSSNNTTIHTKPSGDCDISYQIRYVEENQRGGQDPWSRRHTGVFHHHSSVGKPDLFILLHPVRTPMADSALLSLADHPSARAEVCENPFILHIQLCSQYFDNWRWHFRYLGDRFSKENDLAMVVKPEHTEPRASFLRVQQLRNTNDLILFAWACCLGNLDLLTRLSHSSISQLNSLDELNAHESKMKGFIESADVLRGRVQNLIDLVGYTLTLHNQLEAAHIDRQLLELTDGLKRLTQDTVDDSATVKIITFVSAVYLPGSFIATLFGMNFFLFNSTTRRLEISPDFWIFIAAWLPLVLITGAIYLLILYLDSRLKRKTFRWPWQLRPQPANAKIGS